VAEQYKRNPNISCLICGKKIYRRPVEIKRNKGNAFCSVKCYGKFCRKEVPCLVCGKLILAGSNKKTCSRSCANKHREGIKYKLNRPKDKVKTQRFLKIRLLQARGNKCERCGFEKYQILQVHHKDKDRNNNNPDNLEIVCPNCHFEEHYLEKSWLGNFGEVPKWS
jgi:hypothetical protein